MPIKYCPNCNQPILVDEHTGDFMHQCDSNNDVLDKEDEIVIGDSETDLNTNLNYPLLNKPVANILQGTRAGNEGAKNYERTDRGNKKAINREKQHTEYMEF